MSESKIDEGKAEATPVAMLEEKLAQMGDVDSGGPKIAASVDKVPKTTPPTEGAEPGKDATPAAEKTEQPTKAGGVGETQPVAVDDGIPSIPDGTNPNSENWRKLRESAKTFKDEARTERERRVSLERELEEARRTQPTPPKSEEIPDDTVFSLMAGAKAGQFGEERNNKQVLADAKLLIEDMPSHRVLAVLRKAEAGQLGEDSVDIAIAAKDALVSALAREREGEHVRGQQDQKTKEYQAKMQQHLEEAATKFPEITKAESPEGKFASEFANRMLGKMVDGKLQQGPLSMIMVDPGYPVVLAELMHNAYLASTVPGLQAQVAELTKKLNSGRTPQPPGGSPNGGSTSKVTETERILAGMGNISQG